MTKTRKRSDTHHVPKKKQWPKFTGGSADKWVQEFVLQGKYANIGAAKKAACRIKGWTDKDKARAVSLADRFFMGADLKNELMVEKTPIPTKRTPKITKKAPAKKAVKKAVKRAAKKATKASTSEQPPKMPTPRKKVATPAPAPAEDTRPYQTLVQVSPPVKEPSEYDKLREVLHTAHSCLAALRSAKEIRPEIEAGAEFEDCVITVLACARRMTQLLPPDLTSLAAAVERSLEEEEDEEEDEDPEEEDPEDARLPKASSAATVAQKDRRNMSDTPEIERAWARRATIGSA